MSWFKLLVVGGYRKELVGGVSVEVAVLCIIESKGVGASETLEAN